MKIIYCLFLIIISFNIKAQEIAENKIDDFTKNNVMRTSWEKLTVGSSLYSYARISKINDTRLLELKYFTHGVSSIPQDSNIMFMFDDGEIITLKNMKHEISCFGCGAIGLVGSQALGMKIDCLLSDSDALSFKNKTLSKIRIYESDGYLEDVIKPKNAKIFNKLTELSLH